MTTTPRTDAQIDLRPDFPGLDWLRAVGALAVLTTHVAFQTGEYSRHGTVGTILARLDVGVALFFVLSGFLLSHAWWTRDVLDLPAPSTRRYAKKRVLRIMPVYVITAIAALSLVPGNEDRSGGSWLVTLLVADVYVDDKLPQGLTQMWSLAAEIAFYIVLPLLAWVARSRFRGVSLATPLLVSLVVLNVTWVIWIVPGIAEARDWAPNLWLPGYLAWFAGGMWLAREHARQQVGLTSRSGRLFAQLGAQPGVCWALAGGLLLVAATPLAGPVSLEPGTVSQAVVKSAIYAALGVMLVIAGVWGPPKGQLMRRVSGRFVRHLGHVSYSVFCVHLIVIALLVEIADYELFSGDFLRMLATVLALSLVVSELLYWFVEVPAMRLARRPRGSTKDQTATAVHASRTMNGGHGK